MEHKMRIIQKNLTVYISILLVTICVLVVVHAAKKDDGSVPTTSQTELSTQTLVPEIRNTPDTTETETQAETAAAQTTAAQKQTETTAAQTTAVQKQAETTAAQTTAAQTAAVQTTAAPVVRTAAAAKVQTPAPTAKQTKPAVSGTVTPAKHVLTLCKGTGISAVSGQGSYAAGTTVTVGCTVKEGYAFCKWKSGMLAVFQASTKQTFTFTMPDTDLILTAEAESIYTNVTLIAGTGISAVYGGGKYLSGESVTVSCSVQNGYVFSGWSSNTSSVRSSANQRYSFTAPKGGVTLTANAEKTTYTVSLVAGKNIRIVSGGGDYRPGDTVTVECVARAGNAFTGWTSFSSGVRSSTARRYTFTMPYNDVKLKAQAEVLTTHVDRTARTTATTTAKPIEEAKKTTTSPAPTATTTTTTTTTTTAPYTEPTTTAYTVEDFAQEEKTVEFCTTTALSAIEQ